MHLRNVIRSLREDVHVSQKSEHHLRMVAHSYDESEWSLMMLLIRRLGFPQATSAGRSFNELRGSYASCLDHVLLQSTKSK